MIRRIDKAVTALPLDSPDSLAAAVEAAAADAPRTAEAAR